MRNNRQSALTARIHAFCHKHGISLAGKTVLCALSGGRDSVALTQLLRDMGTADGFFVAAAHYNHHLRDTAQRDEDFVRTFCAARGIPLTIGGGAVAAFAGETGTSLEDAGRILRYRFLEETADAVGADFIVTAHHAQDNAETLLLHLLRGAGLQGMSGIPPVRGRILRPLLEVSRAQINDFIIQSDLPYVEDESNAEPLYARNRIRCELLPLLEELSPGSVERIAATAGRLRIDSSCLERQADALFSPADSADHVTLPITLLRSAEPAIALRLIRRAARQLGIELTAVQTEAVLSLKKGGALTLSGDIHVLHRAQELYFFRLPPAPPPLALHPGVQTWGSYRITVRQSELDSDDGEGPTLALRADAPPLTVVRWDGTGRLSVENGRRTVKRLLADHGIPPAQCYDLPALMTGDTLVAVCGAGVDRAFLPCGEKKLLITLEKRG